MMPSVKNTASIRPSCSMHDRLAKLLRRAEIPVMFRMDMHPDDLLARYGFVEPFISQNRIICISGPPESGKTSVITAMLMRGILRFANEDNPTKKLQHLYLDAARTFRSLRKLSLDEDREHPVYSVAWLALDDLDKVEPQYRGLVRDVIVHREQNALRTLISITDVMTIREYGDQVHRRIIAATQLPLGERRISADLRGGIFTRPVVVAGVTAPALPGIELSV
jgi:hypothetical protein